MFTRLSGIAQRTLKSVGLLLAVFIAAGLLYHRSPAAIPFALGTLLGGALSVIKVIWLDRTVAKVSAMDAARAANYFNVRHFLRFVITGLVLLAAALIPFIDIWGAAAGVFTLQIALFLIKRHPEARDEVGKQAPFFDDKTDGPNPQEEAVKGSAKPD